MNSLLVDFDTLYRTPASFQIFEDLVRKYNPRGLWIHDVEIASIAVAHGISFIATNNVSDFGRIQEVEVVEI